MAEDIGIFLADTIQGEDSSLANVGPGMVKHRYKLGAEISGKVGRDDVREAIQRNCDISGTRAQILT